MILNVEFLKSKFGHDFKCLIFEKQIGDCWYIDIVNISERNSPPVNDTGQY